MIAPTMRGLSVAHPSTHIRWLDLLPEGEFKVGVDWNKHKGTPGCMARGRRTFRCTSTPKEVTCRGCLRRMALQVTGEESWRLKIIACYERRNR